MLENCPICGRALRNGQDGKQQIEYPPEKLQEFAEGRITLEQLNGHAIIYYMRPRLCVQKSIPENDGQPCSNYCGDDISNPVKVVEWIKIIDN